jgi:hypothetical protein
MVGRGGAIAAPLQRTIGRELWMPIKVTASYVVPNLARYQGNIRQNWQIFLDKI